MINKIEYAWEDITITMMGRVVERVEEINYDTEVDLKLLYGRGSKPKGIGGGNEKPGGELVLGQSEVEALIRKAQEKKRNGKLSDLTFDIQVHYLSDTDIVKDKIVSARFTKNPKGMKQGDSDMKIKVPFICMDIQYNQL